MSKQQKIRWNITAHTDEGDPIALKEYQDVNYKDAPVSINEIDKISIGSWAYNPDGKVTKNHSEDGIEKIFISQKKYNELARSSLIAQGKVISLIEEKEQLENQLKYYKSLCELI